MLHSIFVYANCLFWLLFCSIGSLQPAPNTFLLVQVKHILDLSICIRTRPSQQNIPNIDTVVTIQILLHAYHHPTTIIHTEGGGVVFSFRILDILSFSINLLYMNSLIFWALLFIIALNIILDTVYGCVCMPLSMIIKAQILDFSTTVQQMISLSSWCFIHFCSRFSVMPSIHRDSYSSSYVLSYFIPYKHFIVEFQFHSGRICRLLQIVSMQF